MKISQPLVSIIIVSYNHEKYINEILNSIKSQTYSNIELIIADDASTDDSVKKIEKWLSDNNYSVIKNFHNKNTGLATVLNECINLSNGEYIKVIAADDYLHEFSIEKCVFKLQEFGDKCGMVFTDFYSINDDNLLMPFDINYDKVKFFENEFLDNKQLLDYNCIIAPTVLIKKDLLLKTGEYTSGLLLEDYDRWLRINSISNITYINEKLAFYRVVSTSISNTKIKQMKFEDLYLRIKFDNDGYKRDEINKQILDMYLFNKNIPYFLFKEYQNYSFKIKSFSFLLKFKLPVSFYKFLNRFLWKIQ